MLQKKYIYILYLIISITYNCFAYELNSNKLPSIPHFKYYIHKNKIFLNINLKNDDIIYWLHSGTEGYPIKFDLTQSENLSHFQILWPFPKYNYNDNKIQNYYYTDNIEIPIYLIPKNKKLPIDFKIDISFLLCGSSCTPVKQNINTKVYYNSNDIEIFNDKNNFTIHNVESEENKLKFIATFNNPIFNEPKFAINQLDNNFIYDIKVHKINDNNKEFLVDCDINQEQYKKINVNSLDIYSNHTKLKASLPIINNKVNNLISYYDFIANNLYEIIITITFAFIGGFILNFMPCILPILSLKILSFKKLKQAQSNIYQISLILTTLGIIFSFLILAVISIIFKSMGKQFGFGIHFQSPVFIILLTIIITIFISSSLSRIQIQLPSRIINFLNNINIKSYYLNSFYSGVLATVLSISCSTPLLGSAMSFALTNNYNAITIIIFIVAGTGFALPYIILLLKPSLIKYFPRTNKYQLITKIIIAVLLILTLLWLLYILYSLIGLRATIGLILLLILLKFIIENNSGIIANLYIKIALSIVIITSSVYLPLIASNEDAIHQKLIDNTWHELNIDKISTLVNKGQIVIVDITASWCGICQLNKIMIWDRDKTLNLIKNSNIYAMRGDYTKPNEYIQNYLKMNDTYGIPFTKVYGPKAKEGITLPSIILFNELTKTIQSVK